MAGATAEKTRPETGDKETGNGSKDTAETAVQDSQAKGGSKPDPDAPHADYPEMTNQQVEDLRTYAEWRKKNPRKKPPGDLVAKAVAAKPELEESLSKQESDALTAHRHKPLAEEFDRIEKRNKESGHDAAMRKRIKELAKELGRDVPAWAKGSGSSSNGGGESKPKREKGWREGTFKHIVKDDELTGSLLLMEVDNPDGNKRRFELLGQLPDDEFYKKARDRVKRNGGDPDTVAVITLRARNARISEAPKEETAAS